MFNLYQVKACSIYFYFKQADNRVLACAHEGSRDSEPATLLFMNTGIVDVEATSRLCNRTIMEQREENKKGGNMLTRYLVRRKINPLAVIGIAAAVLLAGCGGTT